MCKKALGLFLMGTLFILCSCVDDTYDLNKGVTTDVEIKGNKLALPLGSLRAIMLDSLLSVDSLDILNKKDGVYSISMADSIAPYEYEIPQIKFEIPAKETKVEVNDFAKANITEVTIDGQDTKSSEFTVPEISLDELNIPKVNTDRSVSAANDQVKTIIDQFGGIEDNSETSIDFKEAFALEDGKVEFDLTYTLPKEIETIHTIFLKKKGDESDNTENGALIGFEIIHPIALVGLDKTITFEIDFPEEFTIELDPNTTEGQYILSDDGHHITVENLFVEAGKKENSVIQFYIKELKDLDSKIIDGQLSFIDTIEYRVDYFVEGLLKINSNTELEDFNFKVVTDLELSFRDVEGTTKDIEVEFEPMNMAFDITFDNLEHINRIGYVTFDADESKLNLQVGMNGCFTPFTLKEGYALKLKFPEELSINEALSEYPRYNSKGEEIVKYIESQKAFYIFDLEVFSNNATSYASQQWSIALDQLTLNEEVIDGNINKDINATITIVDDKGESTENLVLGSTYLPLMVATLESFANKQLDYQIEESHFIIDDAVVYTDRVVSKLEETIDFSFDNNDLPKELRRIEGIGFGDDTPVFLKIKVNGLGDLKTDIVLDLQVNLPSALEISVDNNDTVRIIDNTLFMKISIDPRASEPTVVELTCNGLNFTKGEGNKYGLTPKLVNNKGYIEYKSTMDITGDVIVEGSEFHAEMLDKEISVDVDFEIGDIEVKDFHGIFYIDDLGGIEESFALNLGDGLDFLNSEENTIVLSDPQISISVDNSISIPISASLSLIGKDAAGQIIEGSAINTNIKIEAAEYDQTTNEVTPRTTNLLITAKPTEKEDYTNLPVENLANLLKQIPASIDIVLTPAIDTTNTQHINLVQPLSFGGNYEVAIPLQFDEFSFVYSDTISNLKAGLGDIMEMFSNVSLGLNMNIKNSMPLQLQFKAIPLDEFGDTIHGFTISEFEIPAGNGQAFCDTITGKDVNFSIASRNINDISALDKLKFDLHATANSTVGGAALRGDQGVKLGDISIEIIGDVKLGK